MDLFFQSSHGKPFYVEVGYFDTVLEIKEKIHKEQGIPVSKQTLIFNGKILNDDLNVHHSEIMNLSLIQIAVTSAANNSFPLPLLIGCLLHRIEASNLAATERNLNEKMQRLKEIIWERDRARIHRSVMNASSPPLNMGGVTTMMMELRFFVQINGDEKIPVEMSAAEKVGELREKLKRMKVKLPEGGFFFVYKHNVMDDDRSLGFHHVAQGDSIEIISGYFL